MSNNEERFKVTKNSGHGTTHQIRDLLNFTDAKKWKRFSSRRLALIDQFGLSERKASEQDDNIKQIASMLRTEFEYPVTSQGEFEKLVTAAVQSVRRNRKRSKKKTMSRINSNGTHVLMESGATTPISSALISPNSSASASPSHMQVHIAPKPVDVQQQQQHTPVTLYRGSNIADLLSAGPGATATQQHVSPRFSPILSRQQMAHNTTAATTNAQYTTANINIQQPIKYLLMTLMRLPVPLKQKPSHGISNFLRETLLINAQRSASLAATIDTYDVNSSDTFTTLETLGQTSIRASVSLIVERHFALALQPAVLSALRFKSTSTEYIDSITEKLFDSLVVDLLASEGYAVNLTGVLPQQKVKTFNLIIGSVVKDNGFDSVLSPLNEIIQTLMTAEFAAGSGSVSPMHQASQPQLQAAQAPIRVKTEMNALSMLSDVSLQVNAPAPAPVPQVVPGSILASPTAAPSQAGSEKLPSVAIFDNIIKKIGVKSEYSPVPSIGHSSAAVTGMPLPLPIQQAQQPLHILPKGNISLRQSFENRSLPQPIHQF